MIYPVLASKLPHQPPAISYMVGPVPLTADVGLSQKLMVKPPEDGNRGFTVLLSVDPKR